MKSGPDRWPIVRAHNVENSLAPAHPHYENDAEEIEKTLHDEKSPRTLLT